MSGLWSPQAWNGIGVVTLVVFMGFGLLVSLQRGWLILGIHHREVIGGRDREIAARDGSIAELRTREARLDETITVQARTISENTVRDEFTERILTELRDRQAH